MCGLFNMAVSTAKSISGKTIGDVIGVGTTPMTESESEAIKPSDKNPNMPKDTAVASKTQKTTAGNTAK